VTDNETIFALLGQDYIDQAMTNVLKCLNSIFNTELDMEEVLYEKISNSKIIRLLIFTFRRSSFVDATKKGNYFMQIFRFLRQLASFDELLNLFV
jgi:hypothetical protein